MGYHPSHKHCRLDAADGPPAKSTAGHQRQAEAQRQAFLTRSGWYFFSWRAEVERKGNGAPGVSTGKRWCRRRQAGARLAPGCMQQACRRHTPNLGPCRVVPQRTEPLPQAGRLRRHRCEVRAAHASAAAVAAGRSPPHKRRSGRRAAVLRCCPECRALRASQQGGGDRRAEWAGWAPLTPLTAIVGSAAPPPALTSVGDAPHLLQGRVGARAEWRKPWRSPERLAGRCGVQGLTDRCGCR